MPSGTGRRSGRSDKQKTTAPLREEVSFQSLPGRSTAGAKQPLKVCVVTSEILGPVKNGGIGTATSALIDNLAGNGHHVTILYTLVQRGEPECVERNWAHWVAELAARNITLTYIPHTGDYREWLRKSWLVKQHLGTHDYDAVYFNEHHGSGYYALAAKRAGLSPFAERVHCVITHGSIEWVFNTNDQRLNRATDLQMIGVERRSVEWADAVIGPSQYLLREYQSYGWDLPRHTYRQPYPFPIGVSRRARGRTPVDEIVFFGRLETRKGLWLFCEALDRMGDALRGRRVTFMGRGADVAGFPSPVFILSRAEKWPCEVNLLLDYSQEQALDYLSKPGRVAVMPSLADNSPCVVYECMQQQIPFIATLGSGADELVHTDCWPAVMAEPNSAALAERLSQVLETGATTAWPRFEAAENLARWKAWNELLADPAARAAFLAEAAPERPSSVPPSRGKATFLFIDDGEVLLGTLMDRLMRQMELFAGFGRFALLSARGEPLRSMLEGALEVRAAEFGCTFAFVAPSSLQRFLQAAKKVGGTLFVTDISDELQAPFVTQSRDMVALNTAAAVSCAAATRHNERDDPVIEDIPAGDLPAAGGIGMPITSSAWAVANSQIGQHIDAADFIDITTGELTPATDVGQIVFHRLGLAGLPVRLIPEVGTIRTTQRRRPRHERHWYRSSVLHAEALGMKPYLLNDGAAWLAASSFGFRGANAPEPEMSSALLPDGHPLRTVAHTGHSTGGLAQFAAALGRADLAVQIATASDGGPSVDELLSESVRSVRNRPAIDLKGLLSGETAIESASNVIKTLRASTVNLTLERRRDGFGIYLADRSIAEGTATFFDVALSGHDSFVLDVKLREASACTLRATVIDQGTGAKLGKATLSATSGAARQLEIPLHGIHGMFCLIVDVVPLPGTSPILIINRMQFV